MSNIKKFLTSLLRIVVFNLIFLCITTCGHFQCYERPSHTTLADTKSITPPIAKVIPKADTLHGDVRIDNYYWLRDRSNPEVIDYLEAENRYTKTMMKHTEEFQERLYKEMLGRIKETDLSVPYKLNNYYYYSRTEEGK